MIGLDRTDEAQLSGPRKTRRWRRTAGALTAGFLVYTASPLWISSSFLRVILTLSVTIIVLGLRHIIPFYVNFATAGRERSGSGGRKGHLLAFPTYAFCLFVLWVLVNILIHPLPGMSTYEMGPVLGGSLLVILGLPVVYYCALTAGGWMACRSGVIRVLIIGGVLIAFLSVQIWIGYAIHSWPDWDAGTILTNAEELAQGKNRFINAGYFSIYPNNIMFVLFLWKYFALVATFGATDLFSAAIVLNAIVLTLGILLTYLVARRLAHHGMAIFTLVLSAVYVVLSPWIAVPYSDTFGLIFPVLLLYLYLLQQDTKGRVTRMMLWAGMGIVGVIGYNIKPTAVFTLIAIAIVALLTVKISDHGWRPFFFQLTGVLVAFAFFAGGSQAMNVAENRSGAVPFNVRTNDRAFSASHFLKMGAQRSGVLFGAYNNKDVSATKSIASERERASEGYRVYWERVSAMGPAGYVGFLNSKADWILGDASFFMWGEGSSGNAPFIAIDPESKSVQDLFGFHGNQYQALVGFWQAFWFPVLGLLAWPLFSRSREVFGNGPTVMRLSLLALFAFLLLFEARSRYLYLYVPFFVLLASISLETASTSSKAALPRSAKAPHSSAPFRGFETTWKSVREPTRQRRRRRMI